MVLLINRFEEVVYEEVVYDPSEVILGRLAKLEDEIIEERKELEKLLK